MKTKSLLSKLKLTDADFEALKAAVAKAESKTSGEIALALTAESAHYSFWELLFSNFFAALILVLLIPFANELKDLYQTLYWQNQPAWVLPAFYLSVGFFSIILAFYLSNIPAIDRLIIPSSVRRSSVTHRAFRHFTESGVYATSEHSGLLIFISYMERQVRIIADKGLSQKISQDMWNLIADELAENISKGNITQALQTAVEKCGDLLAQNFPASENNPNELSDGLVILEDSAWF